ncbi:MAG: helix-turn-helix domain-containing protein, partial [Lachnospiraceae bacterium]|nr:helix-turn-helix domain-containing protein [Lachnospiraceae bacterium]
RIKAAMKLLGDVRYKVYEVAEKVGYKDITYFSSVFKKITGLNPSDFQNKIHNV